MLKRKCALILIVLTFVFNSYIFAEDYSDMLSDLGAGSSSTKSKNSNFGTSGFKLSLLGEHAFEFHVPVMMNNINFHGDIKAPRFTNDLGIEISYKTLSLVSHWEIDFVLDEFGSIENVISAMPLENSIKWSPWKFNISAGYQYFTWGTADGLNPTDNLNPLDYTTGAEYEKLSVLSAAVSFYPVDFLSLECVYIPFNQVDKFPLDIPAEIAARTNITPTENTLPFDPKSFVMGGKINFFFQYIDFSFSYVYDVDKYYTPNIELKYQYMGLPAYSFYMIKSIELERKRLHHFGADLKASIDRFGLWLEVCYSMSEDYLMNSYYLRNHKLSWVLGFDFNYGPNDDFYFNVQYLGEFNPLYYHTIYQDYEPSTVFGITVPYETGNSEEYYEEYYYRSMADYMGAVTEGLLQGLSVNMQWPVLDSLLTPSFTAAYMVPLIYDYSHEVRYGSLALNPELDIMPIDSFHIVIGANLYYSWYQPNGEAVQLCYTDKIGTYYGDSNIYLELRYKWGFDFRK